MFPLMGDGQRKENCHLPEMHENIIIENNSLSLLALPLSVSLLAVLSFSFNVFSAWLPAMIVLNSYF